MQKKIGLWKKCPEVFFRDVLKSELWEKQVEIAHSLRDVKETFVQSCNAAGKTHLAAGLVLWWVFTRRGIVVTTAPTWRQVQDVLWQKIKEYVEPIKDLLGCTVHQTRMNVGPMHYATGLSTTEPSKFQGYHAKGGVLIVVDEAAGVEDPEIWGAIDGNTTSNADRVLAIGNPTDPTGEFARRCKRPVKGLRNRFKISAFDTPNLKAGWEKIQGLVTKEWVDLRTSEWGTSSPLYAARIMGEFPTTGGDSLFPLTWLERAFNYHPMDNGDLALGPVGIGVDIAGSGNDNNAIALRDGGVLEFVRGWPSVEPEDLVDNLFGVVADRQHTEKPVNWMTIDSVGVGWPVYRMASARRARASLKYHDLRVSGFVAQSSPRNDRRFANRKAEVYWNFRELLRKNEVDMSLLGTDMRALIEKQASAIRYWPSARGQTVIEEKRALRNREGWSPDELEAAIMAYMQSQGVKGNALATIEYGMERGSAPDRMELNASGVADMDHDWDRYDREWSHLNV